MNRKSRTFSSDFIKIHGLRSNQYKKKFIANLFKEEMRRFLRVQLKNDGEYYVARVQTPSDIMTEDYFLKLMQTQCDNNFKIELVKKENKNKHPMQNHHKNVYKSSSAPSASELYPTSSNNKNNLEMSFYDDDRAKQVPIDFVFMIENDKHSNNLFENSPNCGLAMMKTFLTELEKYYHDYVFHLDRFCVKSIQTGEVLVEPLRYKYEMFQNEKFERLKEEYNEDGNSMFMCLNNTLKELKEDFLKDKPEPLGNIHERMIELVLFIAHDDVLSNVFEQNIYSMVTKEIEELTANLKLNIHISVLCMKTGCTERTVKFFENKLLQGNISIYNVNTTPYSMQQAFEMIQKDIQIRRDNIKTLKRNPSNLQTKKMVEFEPIPEENCNNLLVSSTFLDLSVGSSKKKKDENDIDLGDEDGDFEDDEIIENKLYIEKQTETDHSETSIEENQSEDNNQAIHKETSEQVQPIQEEKELEEEEKTIIKEKEPEQMPEEEEKEKITVDSENKTQEATNLIETKYLTKEDEIALKMLIKKIKGEQVPEPEEGEFNTEVLNIIRKSNNKTCELLCGIYVKKLQKKYESPDFNKILL